MQYLSFMVVITIVYKRSTYAETVKDDCCIEAIRKEIHTLEDNETWKVKDFPPMKKVIESK